MHLSPWRSDLSWIQMHSIDVMLTAAAILMTLMALTLGLGWLVLGALLHVIRRLWSHNLPERAKKVH